MSDARVCYWPTWTALPRRPWVLRGTDGSNWRVKDSLWSKRFDTAEAAIAFAERHGILLTACVIVKGDDVSAIS